MMCICLNPHYANKLSVHVYNIFRFGQGYTVSLKVDPTKQVPERQRSRRTSLRRSVLSLQRSTSLRRSVLQRSNTVGNLKCAISSKQELEVPPPVCDDIVKVTAFFEEKFPGTMNLEKHQVCHALL